MAELVYLLCMLTGAACAWLLTRSYRANRSRFLLWSSICFGGLAVTNALLFVDLVLWPQQLDLAAVRAGMTLASLLALVFGLVWETR